MIDTAILIGYVRDNLGSRGFSVQLLDKPLLLWIFESLKTITRSFLVIVPYEGYAKSIVRSGITLPDDVDYTILINTYIFFEKPNPLSGIYTALTNSISSKVFIVTPNYPLIKSSTVMRLLKLIGDYDVVVIKLPNGLVEPLLGIYSTSIVRVLENALERGVKDINKILSTLKVKIVPSEGVSDKPELEFKCIRSFSDIFNVSKTIALESVRV